MAGRHLHTRLFEPLFTEAKRVTLAEDHHIGFFLDEMGHALLVHEAHGDNVIALCEQARRYLIAPWRILIIGAPHLATVHVSIVLVVERAQQQARGAAGMAGIDVYVLAQPKAPDEIAAFGQAVVLANRLPSCIVAGKRVPCTGNAGIVIVEHLKPAVVGQLVGTHLRRYHFVVLIELRLPVV